MRYSTLGKTGLKVSALGFGCMRLPMTDGKVDRDKSTPMLRKAYELGVTYFDTAIGYCNSDSQAALGEAVEPFRDTIVLSTKNHHTAATESEWWKALEDSLRFLRTDHIDLYHHHGIQWEAFEKHLDPAKNGKTKLMMKAKEQGLIRHIAFSFHDTPEALVKLIDTGYYENVILQYNLLDQGNADAIRHAHEKGMGVVVMGPVGGGRLGLPSEQIIELTGGAAKSTPEAALRFVWAHPGVNVALSGMETMAMLEENVKIADNTTPFTPEQVGALNKMVKERKEKSGLYCSGCRYCTPVCSVGVRIPENLDLLNQVLIYGFKDAAKQRYGWIDVKAADCINCGKCIPKCPQGIKIPDKLRETALLLDSRKGTVVCGTHMNELRPNGSFKIAVTLFNFDETARDVHVGIGSNTGIEFETTSSQVKAMPAMARRTLFFEGKTEPGAPFGYFLDVSKSDSSQHIDKDYKYLILKKGISEDWNAGEWRHVAPGEADFSESKETCGKHGIRFKLTYDDAGLLLLADVRDDFLSPSSEDKNKGSLVDGLEVYLDGRAPSKLGMQAYDKGVYQVMMYPGTPGKHPAFYSSGQNIEGLAVTADKTSEGYRIKAQIPFASFCVEGGLPKRVRFDIGCNTADAAGNRIGQFIYAGTKDNWNNASGFMDIWLA